MGHLPSIITTGLLETSNLTCASALKVVSNFLKSYTNKVLDIYTYEIQFICILYLIVQTRQLMAI
jgi:hypothetical protein